VLTRNANLLTGEFIQSCWFKKQYTKNSQGTLVVLQVGKDVFTKTVEKDMNSLKNPFPSTHDVPPYVKRASYFVISREIINGCIENINQEFNFTVRATNNPWYKLTLTTYKNDKGILLTYPSFEIPII